MIIKLTTGNREQGTRNRTGQERKDDPLKGRQAPSLRLGWATPAPAPHPRHGAAEEAAPLNIGNRGQGQGLDTAPNGGGLVGLNEAPPPPDSSPPTGGPGGGLPPTPFLIYTRLTRGFPRGRLPVHQHPAPPTPPPLTGCPAPRPRKDRREICN